MTLFKWLSGSLSLLICLLSPTNNSPPYFISPSPPPHLLFEVKKALTGRCFTETVFSILSYVGSSTFSPIPRRVRIFQWQDKNRLLPPLHIMENWERGGEKNLKLKPCSLHFSKTFSICSHRKFLINKNIVKSETVDPFIQLKQSSYTFQQNTG